MTGKISKVEHTIDGLKIHVGFVVCSLINYFSDGRITKVFRIQTRDDLIIQQFAGVYRAE